MLLPIVKYPSTILREPTEEVTVFDLELKKLVDNMDMTMHVNIGIGLAAPQVGVLKKVAIVYTDQRYVLINPKIVFSEGSEVDKEGCLSFPGVFENIERATHIIVEAQDETGEHRTYDVTDITARAMQHEIEHLEGKLMVDHLSPIRRDIITRKLKKKKTKGVNVNA